MTAIATVRPETILRGWLMFKAASLLTIYEIIFTDIRGLASKILKWIFGLCIHKYY